MNWNVVIAAYVLWAGCMGWVVWTKRLVTAMPVIFVSGYALLPVPVDLKASEWIGIKTWVVSGVALLGWAVGSWREKKMERGVKRRRGFPEEGARLQWWDAFMVALPFVQIASEVVNKRGESGVIVVGMDTVMQWLVPYVIGRKILRRMEDMEDLGRMVVWSAAGLVPLALYEVFFKPEFHAMFYGTALIDNNPAYPLILNRWGFKGFRPSLFFEGGQLASSFYFAAAAVIQGFLMAVGRGTLGGMGRGVIGKKKWDAWVLAALVLTVINSRAFLGIGAMVAGFALLGLMRGLRARVFLVLLVMVLPVWVGLRATQMVRTPALMTGEHADPLNKNYSLWYRMHCEDMAMKTVRDQDAMIFGLGSSIPGDQGWRQRVWPRAEIGDVLMIDGKWAWLVLRTGWIGFTAAALAIALPLLMGIRAVPRRMASASEAVYVGMIVVVGLDLADWAINRHESVVWALMLGGIARMATIRRPKEMAPMVQKLRVESIEVIDPRDGTVTRVQK